MNYINLILIAIIIILSAVFLNRKEKSQRSKNGKDKPVREENGFQDLNEKFLQNCEGKRIVDLVKVFRPHDRDILRSILDSEGIETYVKSNNFGDLYPTYDVFSFSTTVISIFAENTSPAKSIVEEYINILSNQESASDDLVDGIRTAGAVMVGIPPKLSSYTPEILIK